MEKEYYIKLHGKLIPVTEEVYRAYQQPKWRENIRDQKRAKREISLDAMKEVGREIWETKKKLVDDIVIDKLLLEALLLALDRLSDDERFLIDEIFYKGKSEREVARKNGLSKTGVHKKKERILASLRKLLKIR